MSLEPIPFSPPSTPDELASTLPASVPPPVLVTSEGKLPSVHPTLRLDASAVPLGSRPPTSSRTVKLTVEEHLAMMRPPPVERAPTPSSVPPPVTSAPRVPAAASDLRPRRLLLGGLAAAVVLFGASFAAVRGLSSMDHRWVAPTLLSSTDPRVLQVAATLQQETARRNDLRLQSKEIEARLADAKRSTELEEGFQASFKAALHSDLDGQRAELRRVQYLLVESEASKESAKATEKPALEAKLGAVRQRIRMLEAASKDGRAGASYDVLALRREYDRSVIAAEKTRELSTVLAKALADTDDVLKQKEILIASIESSPYRLAIAGDVALGFLPYENAAQVKTGDSLVACKVASFLCTEVGTVGDLLPGEARGAHPVSGQEMRGQLIALTTIDPRSAELPMLHVRPAPSKTSTP